MKKQDIQTLAEKVNIELDEIQRVRIETYPVLLLVINDNFSRSLYLQTLKEELKHLLGYFERLGKDKLNKVDLKGELESAKGYCDGMVEGISDKYINEITLEDVAKVKAYQRYIAILCGELGY